MRLRQGSRRVYITLVLLQAFFVLLIPDAFADELVPVQVEINHGESGETLALVRDDGDVWLPYDYFAALKTSLPFRVKTYKDQEYISLRAMGSRLRYTLDSKALTLRLDVNPYFLKSTLVDYGVSPVIRASSLHHSAFLNYSINYLGSNEGDFESREVPLELVVSAKSVVVRSNYLYREFLGERYWSRGISQLIHDQVNSKRRFVLGDFFANSGEMGGSGIFAGLGVSKHLSIHPGVTNSPGLSLSGILASPSRVDVYVNKTLVRSEQLPPGEYQLKDIPNVYGGGEASVVITDAFGREKTFSEPYYVSSRLLRKGMQEYSYNLGWRRIQIDAHYYQYADAPVFLARHSYGLNSSATIGYRFESDEELFNLRASTLVLPLRVGELEVLGAYSHYRRRNAYGGLLRYSFVGRHLHLRANVTGSTPWYAHTSFKPDQAATHLTQTYSLGVHGFRAGSASLLYTRVQQQNFEDSNASSSTDIWSLLFNRRMTRGVHLFVRLSRSFAQGKRSDNILLGVNTVFGRRLSANYAYSQHEDRYQNSASFQKSAPLGEGAGLRMRVLADQNFRVVDQLQGDLSAVAKMQHGQLNLNYFRLSNSESYQARLSGALAVIDSSWFLTRPIYDSFGVARVADLDDVNVYLASEHMGSTRNGMVIIPNMSAYSANRLSIRSEDIPVDMSLGSTDLIAVPAYRSGVIAPFDIQRFQAISGTLVFKDFGVRRIPEFASLVLDNGQRKFESIVGKGGLFYFENIATGEYAATLSIRGQACEFKLKVPPSKETLIELGEQTCVR